MPPALYAARLAAVRRAMAARGLDALIVYGDREHFANLHWLTHYDPRFEESLLVVLPDGAPALLVGNEGMGYSTIARLEVRRILCQTFSLLGQPRDASAPLDGLLGDLGLRRCRRVGTAGWKYFSEREFPDPRETLDLPEFVARALRGAMASGGRLTNETDLLMDPCDGLRNLCEPEQLAEFEWIATANSQALMRGVRALKPGMTEREVYARMGYDGTPLSCYAQCASGEMVLKHFMPSPTDRRIRLGDPIFMTHSYRGANVCRFGWVARDRADLPTEVADYAERVAAPYAAALARWYETLRVGAAGGALHRAVVEASTPHGLTYGLNIGHQIAMDEWTHSLVTEGSRLEVRSGMYLQADFFARAPGAYFAAFAEDGVAVADAELRRALASRYPAMWARIQARRAFMSGQLGIHLAEDVLPFSDIAGALFPYFLSPEKCLARS